MKPLLVFLYENPTVDALKLQLPLNLSMSDLHSNEKYTNLEQSLPTNTENVGAIHSGDLMLFGNDTFVLFYEAFSTSYAYTKLGYLENPSGLSNVLGSGDVNIKLEIYE